MMEYAIVISISALQFIGYSILDKREIRFPKWILLIILLLGQLSIFPYLWFWWYGFDEIKCGMPILAIHFFFLVIGGSLNIVSHFIYYFNSRLRKTA